MIWALAYVPALAGLAIWAIGGSRGRLAAMGVAASVVTLLLCLGAAGQTGKITWSDTLALQAALPPLAQAVAMLVPAILLPITIFAASHEEADGLPRLIGLMLVFTGGMELVVIADDLVPLLIGWEFVGACSWALIGHRWRAQAPGLSGNFAFVLTRAGDLGLFLAVLATFAGAGGTSYAHLDALTGWPLSLAAFGLLVAAVSKAGQVPFAPWLFRAMDGPTSVSALLHSATMVAAGAYILARLQPSLSGAPGFGVAAMTLGLGTALLGGVVALRQIHAKKVLAGSTSAQMGLMIATVGAGYPAVAVLHLIVHAATKAALFCSAGVAHRIIGSFDLRAMHVGRALPVVAILTGIAALSLAAVPPLSGAWSKEAMVHAVEHAGIFWAAAIILAGGLSAAYSARFAILAFGPGDDRDNTGNVGELAALIGLSGAVLALSALWLPSVQDAAAIWLNTDLPSGSRLGLIASLCAVALGLLAGLRAARSPADTPAREWLGLSALYQHGIIRPFHALAGMAARVDDRVIDGIPRSVATFAHAAARHLARADAETIDGFARDKANALRPAAGLWRGAVATVARGTEGLAAIATAGGERLTDLVPNGGARIAGMAGADLRRLQTGLSHHYYVMLVAGLGLAVGLLIFGG
ncbi:NADH-quinone oxidoreductase subunit 5 family protein [Citreimonas sp.]|uniref:NADH-quinone oxidoreductase subunit 5 family protein n=1 Tax=Citreimonas sp. TaxID=3036715 RepID=UPI0040586AB3